MSRKLPAFPSTCDIWSGNPANEPWVPNNVGPARISAQACEVVARWTPGDNQSVNPTVGISLAPPLLVIYFPKGTDVRPVVDADGPDTIEVPVGSGRIYTVGSVFPVALGFSNEFLGATITLQLCDRPF